jgi:hypothetical protein
MAAEPPKNNEKIVRSAIRVLISALLLVILFLSVARYVTGNI